MSTIEPMPDVHAIIAKLSDFDRDVLRTAAGDDRLTGWGAAVTETVEHLQGLGLLDYGLTRRPTKIGAAVVRVLQKAAAE